MSEGIPTFRERTYSEDEQPPGMQQYHAGMSLLHLSNSSSDSNRSISSNISTTHLSSTMPRSNPPGASLIELNRSMSNASHRSSNGNVELPAGSSLLYMQRSNSNQSTGSISDPPGTSMMNLNGPSIPGSSLMNLNRSISNRSTNSNPGMECLNPNTQTLPHNRPALMPGMSIIDNGDECHSAPVKNDSSTFNFDTHPRSSSTRVAGTSMLSITGNPSMLSVLSNDDGRAFQNFPMPGTSMLLSGREPSCSQASLEAYTTALMDFRPAQTANPAPRGQPEKEQAGHQEQQVEGLHQMERPESSSMEDWMFMSLGGGDDDILQMQENMAVLKLDKK